MRIPGYCQKCRRIRTVSVRIPRPGGVQVGICQQCEDDESERRNEVATGRHIEYQLMKLALGPVGGEAVLVEYDRKNSAAMTAHRLRHVQRLPGRFEIHSERIDQQNRWRVTAKFLGRDDDQPTELNEGTPTE